MKTNEGPYLKGWIKVIDKTFPKESDKTRIIAQTYSAALALADFVHKMQDFVEIPTEVRYRLALILNTFMALKACSKKDCNATIAKFPYVTELDDATLETRLGLVIKQMYEMGKELGWIKNYER